MNNYDSIEKMLEMPCYLIDILPKKLQLIMAAGIFPIDKYWRKHKNLKIFAAKITNILLKLNCYYDFDIGRKDKWKKNPIPAKLAKSINKYILDHKGCIYIFVGTQKTMILINGGDSYISVYNPDEKMKDIIIQLAKSEGFFSISLTHAINKIKDYPSLSVLTI